MYKKIDGGSKIHIQGLDIWIPPVGYGVHSVTGELAQVDVIKRSINPKEQYWVRQAIPDDYEDRFEEEEKMSLVIENYVDKELEKIRNREWHRRIYGCWVFINGKPTYIPGCFYFYLNYWPLDTGLPDYREIDLEYFYFWQYCCFDPLSYGMIEVCKRRNGKTYRAACLVYEGVSRTKKALGGIVSKKKDGEGGAAEVFDKAVVPQFQELPSFFRPIWDESAGSTPKGKLRFFKTSKKGKEAKRNLRGPELKSTLDYRDSKPTAYDGSKTYRLLLDESGKTETDVIKRHILLKKCCEDQKRRIVGKMIVTSTVEEIGVAFRFDVLWDQSDALEREKNGKTKSGLYRFFIPADRSGDYDIYGVPAQKATYDAIMADRAAEENPSDLIDMIRKEPLSAEEAFKTANDACHFNLLKLNDRYSELRPFKDDIVERGNFIYKNGEQDTDVIWVKDGKGRWLMPRAFLLKTEETNKVEKRGTMFFPMNRSRFCSAVDPFDHDTTEDNRRSNGASLVKQISNIQNFADPFISAYVCMYLARPLMSSIMYEDMIKQCRYFGTDILAESNKPGILKHFRERGYGPFLQHLPGYKEPGIPSTQENKNAALCFVEEQIESCMDKFYFMAQIDDLIKFDVKNTQKYDVSMATLWVEMAHRSRGIRTEQSNVKKITDYFPSYNSGTNLKGNPNIKFKIA